MTDYALTKNEVDLDELFIFHNLKFPRFLCYKSC